MSMRLFSEQAFFKELERLGFKKTVHESTNSVVVERGGEQYVIRRGRDNYPDYIIDELLRHADKDGGHIEGENPAFFKIEGAK